MQLHNSKNGEDIFKDRLSDFTPTPPNSNWQKIASQLEGEELDAFVKNKLEFNSPTPDPKIWSNIKRKLPLSLLVRNQLNWLSRIAAVLIIFMVVILVMDKKETPISNSNSSEIAVIDNSNVKPIIEAPSDFVFAINESNNSNNSASEELFLDDEKTLEDFWSSLEKEEDFIADVDEEVITRSLRPLLQLPIENLEAAIPSKNRKKPLYIFQHDPMTFPNGDVLSDEK